MRDRVLWLLTVSYALLYFALGTLRYAAHRNFVDLGIFAQTAASAFGCFCNTIEGSHWAYHFSPILYLAGALMLVWRSPLALVALQAAGGALAIAPVYAIVARRADRAAARLAALVVFAYPPLAGLTFGDFHENGLAPAAVAWLLWAFDGGLTGWTIVFALVTLSIKEDQAIFLAVAGGLAAWRYRADARRARLALGIAAASLVVLVVFFAFVQPHANANPQWSPTRFYNWSAADWRALFPAGLLQRVGFLVLAFLPLLFLPLRVPEIAIAIAPLCETLFSRMPTTFTMGSHYAGAWIGYAVFAFAVAVRRIATDDPARARYILYWCVGLCALEFAVADPLHPGYLLRAHAVADARLDRFLATLPPHAGIATQEEAYTHLAASDPNATLLPESAAGRISACYILTDTQFPRSPRLVESAPLVRQLVRARIYTPVRRDGAITLYKRSAACR
ncbi:MAG: DUF2079 domain-containing protein [Vulcanimicrobiaceae bacterium]